MVKRPRAAVARWSDTRVSTDRAATTAPLKGWLSGLMTVPVMMSVVVPTLAVAERDAATASIRTRGQAPRALGVTVTSERGWSASAHRPGRGACRPPLLEKHFELPQESLEPSQPPRQAPMRSPPDEPLECLVDAHGTDLQAEVVPAHGLAGCSLVLLDVGDLHRPPLVATPARTDAREIKGARTEHRRFPVDDRDPGTGPARPEHDVLAEELSVDHAARQRAEPVEAGVERVESGAEQLAFPQVHCREQSLDLLRTSPVMPPVPTRQKLRLTRRYASGRRVKTRGPARGVGPLPQVQNVVEGR